MAQDPILVPTPSARAPVMPQQGCLQLPQPIHGPMTQPSLKWSPGDFLPRRLTSDRSIALLMRTTPCCLKCGVSHQHGGQVSNAVSVRETVVDSTSLWYTALSLSAYKTSTKAKQITFWKCRLNLTFIFEAFKGYVKKRNVYKPWDCNRRILFFSTTLVNKRVDKVLGYIKVQMSLCKKEKVKTTGFKFTLEYIQWNNQKSPICQTN